MNNTSSSHHRNLDQCDRLGSRSTTTETSIERKVHTTQGYVQLQELPRITRWATNDPRRRTTLPTWITKCNHNPSATKKDSFTTPTSNHLSGIPRYTNGRTHQSKHNRTRNEWWVVYSRQMHVTDCPEMAPTLSDHLRQKQEPSTSR